MGHDQDVATRQLILRLTDDRPVPVVPDILDQAIQTLRNIIRAPTSSSE